MIKTIVTYLVNKLSDILKSWDDNNTGIDDAMGNALKIAGKVLNMAETGEKLTLQTAEELIRMLSDILANLDKDDEGWDDFASFILEKNAELIMAYRNKDYKELGVISLEIVHFVLTHIDKNNEGIDDELAKKIDNILNILE